MDFPGAIRREEGHASMPQTAVARALTLSRPSPARRGRRTLLSGVRGDWRPSKRADAVVTERAITRKIIAYGDTVLIE